METLDDLSKSVSYFKYVLIVYLMELSKEKFSCSMLISAHFFMFGLFEICYLLHKNRMFELIKTVLEIFNGFLGVTDLHISQQNANQMSKLRRCLVI